mgnify:CR=1 FL=1
MVNSLGRILWKRNKLRSMTDVTDESKSDPLEVPSDGKKAFYEEAGVSRAMISGTYVMIFSLVGSALFWAYSIIATGNGLKYNTLASAIVGIFIVFSGGFAQSFIAKVKKEMIKDFESAKRLVGIYFKILMISAAVMTTVAIILALFLQDDYISVCIWLALPQIVLGHFGGVLTNLLSVKNRYDITGAIGGFIGIWLFIFGALFIYVFNFPPWIHGILSFLIALANLGPRIYYFKKKTPFKIKDFFTEGKVNDPRTPELIKDGLFSTVTNLDSLGQFGNIIFFLTAIVLGVVYPNNVSSDWMDVFSIVMSYVIAKVIFQFFAGPLNVEMSEAVANDDMDTAKDVLNSVGKLTTILGSLLLVIIAAFSGTILIELHPDAFYNEGVLDTVLYKEARIFFILCVIGHFEFGFASFFGNALVAVDESKRSAKAFGYTLIIAIVLTPILTYFFGLMGAGIATLICGCFVCPYMLITMKKAMSIEIHFKVGRQIPHLTVIALLFFLYPIGNVFGMIVDLVIVIAVCIVVLAVFMNFFGVLEPEDYGELRVFTEGLKLAALGNIMTKAGIFIYNLNPVNRRAENLKKKLNQDNLSVDTAEQDKDLVITAESDDAAANEPEG